MDEVDHRCVRFEGFEADFAAGELRKHGQRVPLQEQPFQILAALLERPGRLVTRQELRERLWPGRPFIDSDQGLNTAMNKLRDVLGDSAAAPRFVETVPRRGYRFISGVDPAMATASAAESPAREALKHRRFPRKHLALTVAAAAGLAGIGAWLWPGEPPAGSAPALRRYALSRPLSTVGATGCNRSMAISPDARKIAFTEGSGADLRLWIQDLDREQPRPVKGSEGAQFPFWSPDSRQVGFTIPAKRALMRIGVDGGIASRICDLPGRGFSAGAAWSPDGETVVFATFGAGEHGAMYEAPAAGGTPRLVMSPELLKGIGGVPAAGLDYLHGPHFLPAGPGRRIIVFGAGWTDPVLLVADLDRGQTRVLGKGRLPVYSPSGHLVFQRAGETEDVWAQPFSLREWKTSAAFPIARNGVEPSVARDGTLAYADPAAERLAWLDRGGRRAGATGFSGSGIYYPSISPDGRKIAAEVNAGQNYDIWVHDPAVGARTRLSMHPALEILPVWSPDGEQVAYGSWRAGKVDIFSRRADAGAEEVRLTATPASERVSDWSADGKRILYSRIDESGRSGIWYLQRRDGGDWEQVAFLQARFQTYVPKLSPDGRYVAYLSDESGRDELYVRPFPRGGRQWTISHNGATQPRWARHGRELFYVESGRLMAVAVRTEPEFSAGAPVPLFAHAAFLPWRDPNYDVSADGKRFLLPELTGSHGQGRSIHVVQNWFAEFRGRDWRLGPQR